MMRNGILLAEDTPENIMQRYNCDNLEEAFLILCQKHGKSDEADATLGRVAGQKFLQNSTNQQQQQQQSEPQPTDSKIDPSTKSTKVGRDIHSDAKIEDIQSGIPIKRKLKRNLSFHEQKPDTLIGKLTFTSQIRMKALLTKNLLQLIRQPS